MAVIKRKRTVLNLPEQFDHHWHFADARSGKALIRVVFMRDSGGQIFDVEADASAKVRSNLVTCCFWKLLAHLRVFANSLLAGEWELTEWILG